MNILVQNRSVLASELLAQNNAKQVESLEALASQSDFISLHCPGGADNAKLINSDILACMKSSAFLINTARGEIVDEVALADALQENRIAGAALDVFLNEPAIDDRLHTLPNLVMLPHLGSATKETREAMGFRVLENLQRHFNGDALLDPVT